MAIDLLYPEPTRFDIIFRLFGTPVRVSPGFWILHGLIGLVFAAIYGVTFFFVWTGGIFISILIHEFGHVAAGRFFGARGEIVLTIFGGLAGGSSDVFYRWQRIIVYLAGPLAQLLLGVGLCLVYWWQVEAAIQEAVQSSDFEHFDVDRLVDAMVPPWLPLMWINIGWPLFNLLPVLPLDGGRIAQELARPEKNPTLGARPG